MSWACEFTDALKLKPRGLVVLCGLDITYNAVHKAIWDMFCNNRKADRVPLNFVMFPVDHEYPKAKPKRTSYEWYMPKGILRREWMTKHLHCVPSLIINFFDLDWDDPLWNERLMECSTRLQIIRSGVERRLTKLAVVLIQRSSPFPPGEDMLAKERAALLCAQCELSPKSLFVLPHSDHLFGYIVRLENAFHELSQGYYTANTRKVKIHRDYLNRSTHQLLLIRHQFKIAFYNEMKQDTQLAIKHYKQAYGHCLETKIHDANVLEIKMVAGFINYKICQLSFLHNAPLDAIEQFRKHIECFKLKTGPTGLAFEHSAWLSKQFHLFGDLFDDTIKNGLTAIQTQNPGFYYKQAADHAITRKQLCIGLCRSAPDLSTMQQALDSLEFYGQRPWRAGQQTFDILDQSKEDEGVLGLQALEKTADHSVQIIQLLNMAVAQFRKYKCPRMKWHLLVAIGEEHYQAKDYSNALLMLSRVAQEYRREKWWSLLTAVLTTAVKSAYLIANVKEYLRLSLELISDEICRSVESKTRIQVDLLQVVCGNVPDPEPGCDPSAVTSASMRWEEVLSEMSNSSNSDDKAITYNMAASLCFIRCKVAFEEKKYKANQVARLVVYVMSCAQFAIRFSQLQVVFSDEKYNKECVINDDGDLMAVIEEDEINTNDLLLFSNRVKPFSFNIQLAPEDMGRRLEVTHIRLSLKSKLDVTIEVPIQQVSCDDMPKLQFTGAGVGSWPSVHQRTYSEIECRESAVALSVITECECIIHELLPAKLSLTNNEPLDLSNIRCSLSVGEGSVPSIVTFDKDHVVSISSSPSAVETFQLDVLSISQTLEKTFFIKACETGKLNVSVQVLYNMGPGHTPQNEQFRQTTSTTLEVVEPFQFTCQYLSMKFEKLETVRAGEPFLLQCQVRNALNIPLFIEKAEYLPNEKLAKDDNSSVRQLVDLTLDKDEEATEFQYLTAPDTLRSEFLPGDYKLTFRRCNRFDELMVSATYRLPAVNMEKLPMHLQYMLPSYGSVNKPLDVTYTILNRTGYVQEFEASLDNCDYFVFSGHKQLHFRTLPYASHSINFTLYPLSPGLLTLPQFKLGMINQTLPPDTINKMLPKHIFVMPRECQ